MAIEGVVSDPGVAGQEWGVDNVAGGSGTVAVPYTKLMSGADASAELIGGDAANGLDVDVTRLPALTGGTATIGFVGLAANAVLAALTAITNALPAGTNTLGFVGLAASQVIGLSAGTLTVGFVGLAANQTLTALTAITNALPAGTNTLGFVGLAGSLPAGTNTTGFVGLASNQTLATVTTVGTVTTVAAVTGGGVAHDATDTGAPLKVGFRAESSTAGLTKVIDGDRTDALADVDGLQLVKLNTSWGDLITERQSDTAGTSNPFTSFGATANARNMITQVTIHNAHATTNGFVDFRDGTGGVVFYTFPAPATGGCVVHFNPPLRQPTANTALAYDVSAAITTIYISVNGFKSLV